MLTLTRPEMVAQLRLRCGLPAVRPDCIVTRNDGIDPDSLLEQLIDDRYLHLLDTADPSLLPVTDLADTVTPHLDDHGVVTITLPPSCRRILSVQLQGWHRPASIIDSSHPEASLQISRYVRGGANRPIAVRYGRSLKLYSAVDSHPELLSLQCICDPTDGIYVMDRAALPLIFNNINPDTLI